MTSEDMLEGKTGGPTPGNTFRYTLRLWESSREFSGRSESSADDQVEDLDTDDPAVLGAVLRAVADRVDPFPPTAPPRPGGQPETTWLPPGRPPLTYDDGRGDGWVNGIVWAAGEAAAQLEAHGVDRATAVDLRDHLEACADHPDRPTATLRGPLAPSGQRQTGADTLAEEVRALRAQLDELREMHAGAMKLAEAMRRQRDQLKHKLTLAEAAADQLRVQHDERTVVHQRRVIDDLRAQLDRAVQDAKNARLQLRDGQDEVNRLRARLDGRIVRVAETAVRPTVVVIDARNTPGAPPSATQAPRSGQPEGEGCPAPENGAQRAVVTQREAPDAERET